MKTAIVPEFPLSAVGRLAKRLAFGEVASNPHATFLILAANIWEKSSVANEIKSFYDIIIIDGFIEQAIVYEAVNVDVLLQRSSIEWFYSFFNQLALVPNSPSFCTLLY